jgi:hypothetical protein
MNLAVARLRDLCPGACRPVRHECPASTKTVSHPGAPSLCIGPALVDTFERVERMRAKFYRSAVLTVTGQRHRPGPVAPRRPGRHFRWAAAAAAVGLERGQCRSRAGLPTAPAGMGSQSPDGGVRLAHLRPSRPPVAPGTGRSPG